MLYTTLPTTNLTCSQLGFGCAGLMGRVGRRDALRALGAAFDGGVNYFDTARAYGWGQSEAVVGEFLRGKRDRVVVATKLGITPPRRQGLLRVVKPLARLVLKATKAVVGGAAQAALRSRMATHARRGLAFDQFTPDDARRSLEQSLTALRTDYVDILHLHEPRPENITTELLGFLDAQRAAGRVRYFGLATDPAVIAAVATATTQRFVFQLGNSLLDPGLERLPVPPPRAVITHSTFGRGAHIDRVLEAVRAGQVEGLWTSPLRIDLTQSRELARLFLLYALFTNPEGVVLCGMNSVESACANVSTVEAARAVDPELLLTRAVALRQAISRANPTRLTP